MALNVLQSAREMLSKLNPFKPVHYTLYADDYKPKVLGAQAGSSFDRTQAPVPPQLPIPETPKHLVGDYMSAAEKYNIPVDFLSALHLKESSFLPDVMSGATKSAVGATGVGQFMPQTVAELERLGYGKFNPNNPKEAIPASAFYLSHLKKEIAKYQKARSQAGWQGDPDSVSILDMAAAYNAGLGNFKRYGGNIPFDETRNYVNAISTTLGGM